MSPAEPAANGVEALIAHIDPVLDEAQFERALECALERLATLVRAEALALLPVEGAELAGGAWRPEKGALEEALRGEMLRAARGAAQPGSGASVVAGEGGRGVRALPLIAAGRVVGVACFAGADDLERASADPRVALLLRVVAQRLAAQLEATRAAALKAQFERWFRTLDEQVRVLDRERQKFAAMVHQSDAWVFVTDPSGIVRWTNSVLAAEPPPAGEHSSWIGLACRAVCGRFGEQLSGDGCAECPVSRTLVHNQVTHHELRRVDAGAVRNHYLTALPIKGPDGRPAEVMVMIQDLSGLDVLRRSESRYRLLFERSPKAIVMADPSTRRIVLVNPMASRLLGCPREELIGVPLESLHAPPEWARLEAHYAVGFAEKSLSALECRVRQRDGIERIATVSGTLADLDGREMLMLEYTDVTERLHVEEALRAAEERLHTVISNAPIVLFAIDAGGVFTMSEGHGLEALGLEPGEVVGRSVFDVYRDFPSVLAAIRRALAGEEFTTVTEVGKLAFETRYTPLRGTAGEFRGLIGVATDVTDQRRLEDQLRHSQKMEAIGRLAGGVAHDFNNLLAAIMGHSELMLSRIHAGHPLHTNAEEVQKAAARGALLTRQLLAFSRKEVLAPRDLDLNLVVTEMDGMLRRLIGEDIELHSNIGPAPLRVRADRGQLEQVIMNLAVNARDALPRGGRLTIEVAGVMVDVAFADQHPQLRSGPHVLLTVSDDGCGMDSPTLARAFEPFFTTKAQGKGTGLGLSTVYAIIEQSGGTITVYSEPGLGTTFKVYLPRADGGPAASAPERAAGRSLRGSETVLLVEDEDAVRSMAREVLETTGYVVLEARHGPDALAIERAHAETIHLLVTDVVMPQMSGRELAQALIRLRPALRVIYMSGYTDDAVVRHGVLEQGTAFLQKPFALEAFVRKVREVLDAEPPADAAAPPAGAPGDGESAGHTPGV
jgi:two-component system cell cycle sensor histidine kinase/response regulator CckA